jgi:site-specific DNA-methyltransferase (adenine-specific)
MACAVEDAGFEIRDMIAYVYGSGFPKSLDVSKAIDKAAGAEREVVGRGKAGTGIGLMDKSSTIGGDFDITAPATDAARQWAGWGTALKPALEPITVARKPLDGCTVAENVLAHGTGALNIDACRVGTENTQRTSNAGTNGEGWGMGKSAHINGSATGRWPANLIHDGSEEVLAGFPQTNSGALTEGHKQGAGCFGRVGGEKITGNYGGDSGSAARFFYCAKASKAERDAGCDALDHLSAGQCTNRQDGSAGLNSPRAGAGRTSGARNNHPTVKPVALMRYLCRLVTPPGGTVLDPFMGSGSTGIAAVLEGFSFIGVERELEYLEIARARTAHALQSNKQQTLPL